MADLSLIGISFPYVELTLILPKEKKIRIFEQPIQSKSPTERKIDSLVSGERAVYVFSFLQSEIETGKLA